MSTTPAPHPVERIIEEAYGAILDPRRWQTMLELYCAAVVAERGGLHAPPTEGRIGRVFVTHNIDVTPVREKLTTHGLRAPYLERATAMGLVPGAFLHHEVIPDEEIRATDYYREYMRPLDMVRGMTSGLRLHAGKTPSAVALAVSRGQAATHFGQAELAIAQATFPHLRRAVGLTLDVGPERMLDPALRDALEQFATPCCLLGREGRVLFANAAAETALAADESLGLRDGRLTASSQEVADRIEAAALQACDMPAPWSMRGTAEVIVPRPEGPPRALVFAPLGHDNPFRSIGPVRAMLYILGGAPGPTPAGAQRLRLLFALTQAEAEVAELLIAGQSLDAVARRRGVSRSTIESQSKAILEKTQSPRLADLTRLAGLLAVKP